jgi:4-amino-4-deoxy-L-arabinose transferase-like glycosyltransferase
MEFPLLQWIAALGFHVSSNIDLVCRVVTIAFSLGTVAAIYGLGTRLFSRPAGRAAAFLLAVSPSFVFFGRAFISDTPMVFFSVAGVWGFLTYADTGNRRAAWCGAVCTALACMVKVPAVIVLAPIAWCAWTHKRWRALVDPAWVGGVALVIVATAAWYVWADVLFHRTGLGQAIWHPSGGYGPDLAMASGPFMGISHWSTAAHLGDPAFYDLMVVRAWSLHLTPIGFSVMLVAIVACWRTPRRLVADAWLATAVLFILVSAEGQRNHEFHQLPALPPAALLFALGAAPAFDAGWLRRWGGLRLAPIASTAGIFAVALLSFRESQVVRDLFRPDRLDRLPIEAGRAIEGLVPADQPVVVVEYERFGANSPLLLYWAHRKGWSFDLSSITPHVVQRLRRQHNVRYFATTIWSSIESSHPVLAEYLRAQKRIEIALPDTALFELN